MILVDTPGIDEVGGEGREALARDVARHADLILFVVSSDMQRVELEALAKMYVDNYSKANPDAHWATFQQIYGAHSGGVYVVFNPIKSLAEIDTGMASDKKFADVMGESGMKKMAELSASSTESVESQLLVFNPAMSYVSDDWIKADPGFWKPKAAAAAAKNAKPAAKPAQ